MGAAMVDLLRLWLPDDEAFGTVFLVEAGLFVVAAMMAARVMDRVRPVPALIPGE
jgi:BCD family chlorophyll transporter-like MFS transporter